MFQDDPTTDDSAQLSPLFADRFELSGLLGIGGMGAVYKAFDRELEEIVALKMIRRELLGKPGIIERFKSEVRIARSVTHTNVARVYDLGESEGERFLTMEYIDGLSLTEMLDEGGRFALGHALEIGLALSAGLGAAHASGVIHRDLKPDNVLVSREGRVVITDFGIARSLLVPSARVTQKGDRVGTPSYMAPEQIRGEVATEQSDVYALGAVLYEIIVGQQLWPSDLPSSELDRIRIDPPDPSAKRADLPASFASVILRCVARDPSQRYARAKDVARALAGVTLIAEPDLPKLGPDSRRRPSESPPDLDGKAATRAVAPQPQPMIPAEPPPALGAGASARDLTVAVLRLQNLGAPDDDYLADGLTDEIIDALASAPKLHVRTRGMVGRETQSRPAREAGQALDVQVVLDGTMERRGESVHLSLSLTGVVDGVQLLAAKFDRPETELFELVDDVARSVAKKLSTEARGQARTSNAFKQVGVLYLRARHAYHGFWRDEIERALELFQRALAIDPTNEKVLAGFALASLRHAFFTGAGIDVARQAAERSLSLAPELPEAHLAVAAVRLEDGDAVGAVHALGAALRTAPDLAEANALLGRILLEANMVEEGIQRLTWAIALEPKTHLARRDLRRAYVLCGRWEAGALLEAQSPGDDKVGTWLGRARFAVWRRNAEEARTLVGEMANEPETPHLTLCRSIARLAAHGTSPLADPAFVDFVEKARGTPRRALFAAQLEAEVLAYLGDDAAALDAMARAGSAGLADLAWLERCPLLTPYRSAPAIALVRARVILRATAVRAAVTGIAPPSGEG